MTRGIWMAVVGVAIGDVAAVGGEAFLGRHREAAPQPVAYEQLTTIKDLMLNVVDTSADDIWNSFQMTVTKDKTVSERRRANPADGSWRPHAASGGPAGRRRAIR